MHIFFRHCHHFGGPIVSVDEPRALSWDSMILLYVPGWIFALCAVSHAQRFQNGKVIGFSEGRYCDPLRKPQNGRYVCHISNGQEKCKLKCKSGYIVPITYTSQDVLMDVTLRGLYVCEGVVGGVIWSPSLFFDCVEKKEPKNLSLHAGVNFTLPCNKHTNLKNIQRDVVTKLRTRSHLINKTCPLHDVACSIEFFMECLGTLHGDIEVSIPYTKENSVNFSEFRESVDNSLGTKDINSVLRRPGQTSPTRVTMTGFFTDCPKGTRLESDFTCRGCSKGHYLNLSRSECAPCPAGTYQDEPLQATCKRCPGGGSKDEEGLMKITHCSDSRNWRKHTSLKTLIQALSSIVLVGTFAIHFRGTVKNEVRPEPTDQYDIETESDEDSIIQEETDFDTEITRNGTEMGSKVPGDLIVMTNRLAKKVDEELEGRKKSLFLSAEPLPRKSLARDRMRLTLTANMMRRSTHFRKSTMLRQSIGYLKRQYEAEERERSSKFSSLIQSQGTSSMQRFKKVESQDMSPMHRFRQVDKSFKLRPSTAMQSRSVTTESFSSH
ncbi:hypothetical protein RRG08_061828 [Elysia crispata]|uniref:Tyrosine-protein kinase ephrin type A/B receptor-like domain-containing protein n=1 Tax=Elysia crispata TaxID=231223 RepID=A0AAE1DRW8_9GAST|nr:hypothetical protein RRG08_061828 [Elysia crispata]